jgi:hypothetical protein
VSSSLSSTSSVNVPVVSRRHPKEHEEPAVVPLGRSTSEPADRPPAVTARLTPRRSPAAALNLKQSTSPAAPIVPVAGAAPNDSVPHPTGLLRRWTPMV